MDQKQATGPAFDDVALRAIVEGVEAETGENFFRSLVRHLAAALSVQYAFISELNEARSHFRTLALWGRGRFLDNLEFAVSGTPCEAVLNGQMSHHPEQLQQLFPADRGLADWGVQSYCGVPLLNSHGTAVGHLAILDDKPMTDGPRGISIMRIFAARVRAEIERLKVNATLRESEERLGRILASAMDAIVTIDERHRIELFNHAAEKIFGCPTSDAMGREVDRFLTERFASELQASMTALLRGGQTRPFMWAPEGLKARRADGHEFAVDATISQVEIGGRRLFTLILRDIEERQRAQEELRQLNLDKAYLEEEIRAVHNVEEIVGQGRALAGVLQSVDLVATTDSSVLILGETGTGKELIARALHAKSKRKDRPLIKVNCAALPTGLIESELFGHEKGAFTGASERRIGRFELADGGTIFLDEIGEVPLEVQIKLLRILQEQEFERVGGSQTIRVDVRVIAATNRDLDKSVAAGAFRGDLYYRLNVFPILVPPLRERVEDISLLVHYFVGRYATKIGRRITRVPPEAMRLLSAYSWPGNVRELENVIERAVILSSGPDLALPTGLLPTRPPVVAIAPDSIPAPVPTMMGLKEMERSHIVSVLKSTNWRIEGPQGAARLLNLHPSTLRSRMQKLGIRRSEQELS
jgi:formate hydrogenlyase transcriptional activator